MEQRNFEIWDFLSLGERIEKKRIEKGLTQKELGVALGCTEKSAAVRIAQYEIGSRTPKYETIIEIARVLDTTVEDLGYHVPIGERIKRAREAHGLTQKELGEKTGIGEATVRKYELGIRNPKIEKVSIIANALNVDISSFYDIACNSDVAIINNFEIKELKKENSALRKELEKLKRENSILLEKNTIWERRFVRIKKELENQNISGGSRY